MELIEILRSIRARDPARARNRALWVHSQWLTRCAQIACSPE